MAFGKARKAFARMTRKEAVESVPIPGPIAYDTGLKGTSEEFVSMAKLAACLEIDDAERILGDLLKGARQAFIEGRPKLFQTALFVEHEQFRICTHEALFRLEAIHQLSDESRQEAGAVFKAATAGLNAEDRQLALDKMLLFAAGHHGFHKSLVPLLDAGANPQAFEGQILVDAVCNHSNPSVVRMLCERGGDIDAAVFYAEAMGYKKGEVNCLRAYQKHFAATAQADPDMGELLAQLQKQVKELSEQVDRLLPPIDKLTVAMPKTP